jgi:hypothetical protein
VASGVGEGGVAPELESLQGALKSSDAADDDGSTLGNGDDSIASIVVRQVSRPRKLASSFYLFRDFGDSFAVSVPATYHTLYLPFFREEIREEIPKSRNRG